MNPRQLRYFLRIAELQSLTRAASVLHVAQPALSRQMQRLESQLGVTLFKRTDAGVSLTDAGDLLRERAVELLQHFESVRNDLSAYASRTRGSLHVGLPPSMFDLVTVPLIGEYRRRYPDVRLRISEGLSAVLHEAVLAGRMDVAVVSLSQSVPGLQAQQLVREPMYLVGPASQRDRLAGSDALGLEAVASFPLINTGRPNEAYLVFEDALCARGLQANTVLEADSSRLITELVAGGLGWAVLPYCAIQPLIARGRVVAVPVIGLEITWSLVHSRDRGLSVPGQALRDLISETAAAEIKRGSWFGAVAFA